MADMRQDRDLVLAPGEFAYVLDTTKGLVNVNVGPYKTSMAGTDQPVVFDREKLQFVRCDLDRAIQRDLVAPEGFYMALYNPAEGNVHPPDGKSSISAKLTIGHRINIPGPTNFSLWPGQMADVIKGHHLRSNQYLLAQVYNDAEATKNWTEAIVKPAPTSVEAAAVGVLSSPRAFTPGQLIVIKGTDVSFFIPPTGVKVVPNGESFVREAVTLERLEYCILLDEDGNKRFVQGPAVVFPEPTETFVIGADGKSRKFKAIELNETTGIYVKVIADYEEEIGDPMPITGRADVPAGAMSRRKIQHKTGDELFITGKEQAIYFQREEHSVIRYGDQTKHYAVAIPAGEGRYVLDRITGEIRLVRGPRMLLCDPRREVIVRRVLSERETRLMYPGNAKALQINAELAAATAATDASQYEAGRVMRTAQLSNVAYSNTMAFADVQEAASRQLAGDTFARGNKFTPPRTITLDTKYEGAVAVNVWPGYAVNVVDKSGKRRVVQGPATVLLEYDETLAPMTLSTGTPKSDAKLLETVYLRVSNNSISDVVAAETKDFVPVQLRVSYRVNFQSADLDWFAVENYVGLLTDHCRSKLRNAVKRVGIEDFYANAIDIVRDTILGIAGNAGGLNPPVGSRAGMMFSENGMRVYDVEVIEVKIMNPAVSNELQSAQVKAITASVVVAQRERELDVEKRVGRVERLMAAERAEKAEEIGAFTLRQLTAELEIGLKRVEDEQSLESTRLTAAAATAEEGKQVAVAEVARKQVHVDFDYAIVKRDVELRMATLVKESEEIQKRAAAVTPQLATALVTFSDQKLMEEASRALAPIAATTGVSVAEVLGRMFKGTPFAGVMDSLASRSRMPIQEERETVETK